MKKTVMIIVLVTMLVGVFSTVALARYTYIDRVLASISISGGKASVSGTVEPFDPSTIKVKMELEQKPTSGGSWSVYNTWNDSATNSTRFSTSGSCSVPAGYLYRVKVTGTVNGENATATSGECKYQ